MEAPDCALERGSAQLSWRDAPSRPEAVDMDLETVQANFTELLRGQARGKTADITDCAVVYWNGIQPMGVHLCADHPGFDARFELDAHFCGDLHDSLVEWFANPHYSMRPDLVAWPDKAPTESPQGN
jgi:hypothetical protein